MLAQANIQQKSNSNILLFLKESSKKKIGSSAATAKIPFPKMPIRDTSTFLNNNNKNSNGWCWIKVLQKRSEEVQKKEIFKSHLVPTKIVLVLWKDTSTY